MKVPNNKFTRYWWSRETNGKEVESMAPAIKFVFHFFGSMIVLIIAVICINPILIILTFSIWVCSMITYSVKIKMDPLPKNESNKESADEEIKLKAIDYLMKKIEKLHEGYDGIDYHEESLRKNKEMLSVVKLVGDEDEINTYTKYLERNTQMLNTLLQREAKYKSRIDFIRNNN